MLQFQYDYDWKGAAATLTRSIAIGPNIAETRRAYGWYLTAIGDRRGSVAELQRAEALNPTEALTLENLGVDLVAVGLFASRDRADQLVDVLTQAGLPAMQRGFQLRRRHVQQIVLGPYFNRSDAVADLRRVQQLGGYDDATVIDSTREPSAQ